VVTRESRDERQTSFIKTGFVLTLETALKIFRIEKLILQMEKSNPRVIFQRSLSKLTHGNINVINHDRI
jgi:hypothetical protein